MNPLFPVTLLLAAILFVAGERMARRTGSVWLPAVGVILAVPAFIFAVYYTKILGEALWLYWFRSLPFTELSAAGCGLFAGWLECRRRQNPWWKRRVSAFFIPFLTVLCVSAPYLKQVLLRPDWGRFQERWSENVCLQSSESSCGPASAATLLRYVGKPATELEIARAAYTTRRGTENWYLLRVIRQHGVAAHFSVVAPGAGHIASPAIAGVKLKQAGDAGHFIAVLGKSGDNVIIGDPLNGREELSRQELEARYVFTGFYIFFEP